MVQNRPQPHSLYEKTMKYRKFLVATFILTLGVIRQIRSKEYPFALRTFYRALKIPLNIPGHVKLLEVLTLPSVMGLTSRYPLLVYKYLGTYLARSFTRSTRLAIQTNHYRYLSERVRENFLAHLFDHSPTLWEHSADNLKFTINLKIPRANDNEGDISLSFETNSIKVYEISFTIAPAHLLNTGIDQVLLIGRVQGVNGKYELIRQTGKACHGILPGRMLIHAAAAIGLALDIHAIVGLGNGEQIHKDWASRSEVEFDYDEFWQSFNSEKNRGNLFVLPIPFAERPLYQIKSSRRGQALRKRLFRQQLMEQVRAHFEERYLKESVQSHRPMFAESVCQKGAIIGNGFDKR
jgi:uncharacterized protein